MTYPRHSRAGGNLVENSNPVIDNLDLWSSVYVKKVATGRGSNGNISLYGIQKLRELILELAVRGKLVPQDPDDEPASELLEKVAEERADFVKEGKVKKQKPLSTISKAEQQFELPSGWARERFGNLAIIERGGSPRPIKSFLTDHSDGLNWIKIGDTDIGGKYISSTAEKIIQEGLSKTRMVYPGDFLLTNSMSFGRPYITKIEGCIHDGWLRISPATLIDKDYLYWLLTSPFLKKALTNLAAGAVVQNLNSDKVREVVILIPPVDEQHRIVAKVDELMALCDQLEQQQIDSLQVHETLVETLLRTLVDAVDTQSTQQAWSRMAEHFDTLFITDVSIDELKQTILQLAVMGRLVPQDPDEEPASVMLERAAEERAQLIKEGKIKRQKPLSPITNKEQKFHLPDGWAVERFGNLAIIERGGSPRPIKSFLTDESDGLNWIKIGDTDIGGKYITSTKEKIIKEGLSKTRMVFPGDFLLTNSMSFGRPYITKIEGCIHDGWLRISPATLIDKDYLYWLLSSPYVKKALTDLAAGAVVQNLNSDKVREVMILVPPTMEQHRIVAKVDELMALCDAIKARIQETQATQAYLADAIVEQAVA